MKLANKKALVTGASGGIGKAIALQLAKEGADIILHYLEDEKAALSIAEEIEKLNVRIHLINGSIETTEGAISIAKKAWEAFGGVDILVNNSGVSYKKHFLDFTETDVNHFMNVNFRGTFFLTQTIAGNMVANNVEGNIYTITSINAIQPGIGQSVYGASKGALETLMKGVALELAPHNIKVNTLAIGAIQTTMNEEVWRDEEKLALVNENIPMHRLGQPEEIALLITNLIASATYMTGSTITIDGGWLLKHGYEKSKKYTS